MTERKWRLEVLEDETIRLQLAAGSASSDDAPRLPVLVGREDLAALLPGLLNAEELAEFFRDLIRAAREVELMRERRKGIKG